MWTGKINGDKLIVAVPKNELVRLVRFFKTCFLYPTKV